MNTELFEELVDILTDVCHKNHKELTKPVCMNMILREDVGLDSIDLVVLQVELEDRLHIRFDPLEDEFSKIFYNIETLYKCLEMKIGEDGDR